MYDKKMEYCYYKFRAVSIHFSNEKYDYFKSAGKIRRGMRLADYSEEQKRDFHYLKKISELYYDKAPYFFVPFFCQVGTKYKQITCYDFESLYENRKRFSEYESRIRMLEYDLESTSELILERKEESNSFNKVIRNLYLEKEIGHELTSCLLSNRYLRESIARSKNHFWKNRARNILKSKPFIKHAKCLDGLYSIAHDIKRG